MFGPGLILDLFSREVVGWSIKSRMTADIVTDALTMAWFRWHELLDESQGQLLGQPAYGELLQQFEE